MQRTNLNRSPARGLRIKIVNHYWRIPEYAINLRDYQSFFDSYDAGCQALYLGVLQNESAAISAQTHEDLLDVVDTLWSLGNHNFTRPTLRASLERHSWYTGHDIEKSNHTINLALRLWLNIRIQAKAFAPASRTIAWDDTSGIHDIIMKSFPGPRITRAHESNTMIESNFTAVNLHRICGIRIQWTFQLEDHLRFDIERRTLMIYSLATCLQSHLKSSSILPSSIVRETLLSLQLLFPPWDIHTERFLRNAGLIGAFDQPSKYPSFIYLDDFYHWRDRLARLHLEFQSPGPGWRQLWMDRRNRMQWWTFWFAAAIFIMTVIFGVITTVLAFLQTLYSYQSLQLAKAAANS